MVTAIAEDMKKLTENIIISNDVRVKAVGELVADTDKTLKEFAADRKKMAAEQAKDLANFVNGLSKKVQSFLGEFQKSHKQMSKEQAKSLSDFLKNLANDMGSMLSRFANDRGKMSKELRHKLAKEVKDIQTQVQKLLGEADELIGEYRSDMAQARKAWQDMIRDLSKARQAGLVMPDIKAGEKVTTVSQAIGKGKKSTAEKDKSDKKLIESGV